MRSASEVIRRITKTKRPKAQRGGADGDEAAAAKEGCCCGVKRPSLTKTDDDSARFPEAERRSGAMAFIISARDSSHIWTSQGVNCRMGREL